MTHTVPEGFCPPIVEMVLDIDCDVRSDVAAIEKEAEVAFADYYPVAGRQMVQEHKISGLGEGAKVSVSHGVQALQFHATDRKELVQVRPTGFSFNRLAPYSSLDAYLPKVEETWRRYVALTTPAQVRRIKLRYINRLSLPLTADGKVEIDDYLRYGPRLPMEGGLEFVGFLNQHKAVEKGTRNLVNITVATQKPAKGELPIVLDIQVVTEASSDPKEWDPILQRIGHLRQLANRVFWDMVTEKCTRLCQPLV